VLVIQMPLIAMMTLLSANDIPIGTAICVFFQFFGGAIFLTIEQNVFTSRLISSLHTYSPSLDAAAVVAAGAEGLRSVVSMQDPAALDSAVHAYNTAIMSTFYPVTAAAAMVTICAFGIEWKSAKLNL